VGEQEKKGGKGKESWGEKGRREERGVCPLP